MKKAVLIRKVKFVFSPIKKYAFDGGFRRRVLYTKYLEKKPLKEKTILYESYHGQSMTGNPYAVFKYLINNEKYKDYVHVWVVQDDTVIHEKYKHIRNVKFVRKESNQYIIYLATAKYLINDTTFPYYFQKRKDQIYANIWHGTPLKTMGIHIKNRGYTDHKNIQRNFLFTDFMVNPNKFTAEKLLHSHDVYSIFNGKILDSGYPRVDLMVHANKEEMRNILSVPSEKKVILYAPTWRGKLGSEKDESEKLLKDMNLLKEHISDEYIILLKSHYYAYKFFEEQGLADLCVPNKLDTNEVLSIVDILITDYSSIFFDFLPSKKPIIFYAYDEEQYQRERGTYIPMDQLPGPLCHHLAEVADSINHIKLIKDRFRIKYEEFLEEFCYHDDGKATARFVETVLEGKQSDNLMQTLSNKTKILIYGGGFLNNGITSSVINLLNAIDYDHYDVTIMDFSDNNKPEKWKNIEKLNKNIHFIHRMGTWNATLLEWYRHALILRRGIYTATMQRIVPIKMYKRELERIIGNTSYDIGIDFSGYSPFWASIIAFGDFKKKSIYLHNDMGQEINKKVNNKYPHRQNLKVIFSLYNFFDNVVSVSKLTNEQNKKSLQKVVKNIEDRMKYVINNIDYEQILTQKEEFSEEFVIKFKDKNYMLSVHNDNHNHLELTGYQMPDENDINFINIGRLSPEKDHAKLIAAFSHIAANHPKAKLFIVGDGDLKTSLLELVKNLKLEEKVTFTGQISNPYALLHKCDCFVLSSNHEGQPMVLLEALTLGKPVIVTDIPGSRSVIEGGHGLIVENSIKGLIDGMEHFINGKELLERQFDYVSYRQEAMKMFYEKICSRESQTG
ncbi:glycosyltransferase [Bacillus sp. FJAT-49736]|uniref:CDP-glycerol glycerophosphotransferase family protein n=1 Tax=Bacillus sp. FJAT-49736 TaxID=2833582 RepID=UPI001BCA5AB5|nr:CDP-glycerol glycerophosphotransferase family protein [Bacillus sp. FJAT-49736]MBS4175917.1 CDP-glycerol glycerophosphotransferase family protein [Bacillus sp. FJAT-49736]